MTDKEKLKKIKELADAMYTKMQNLTTDTSGIRKAMEEYHQFVIQEYYKKDLVNEDLGTYVDELSKQFPEVSFAKLSRIAVRVAKWQKEHLLKSADGDDLPEIDREVIALLDNGKIVFAHRPDPKGWDAKSIITEKVEHYTPETYDKGGWNIPDVKIWLDVKLSKEIEL